MPSPVRTRSRSRLGLAAGAALLALTACAAPGPPSPPALVVDDAALGDETRAADWLAFGRTYSEQRFSPLRQITDGNVGELGVDWVLELPDDRGLVSTPLVVDGAASTLQAWDPVRQELAWEVPLPGIYSAGTLTTAGNLVFQGRLDGTFLAYRADTGEELWSSDLGLGVSAPPISYAVDGRQYVALLVGWGGAMAGLGGAAAAGYGWAYGMHTRMLVAFSLEGTTALPEQPDPYTPVPVEADFDVDPALAGQGGAVFGLCATCHGPGAVSAGMAPDLRASPAVLDAELFRDIVREGARAGRGMPRYRELSDATLEALRHYIRQQADAALRPSAGEGDG